MGGRKMSWTGDDVLRVLVNPLYCTNVAGGEVTEPVVSREMWVKACAKAIKEVGAKRFLETLLSVLEEGR